MNRMRNENPNMRVERIAYLTLQKLEQGVASYAHVVEIVKGIEGRGVSVDVYSIPTISHPNLIRTVLHKIFAFIGIQIKLVLALRKYDVLYVRAHHLAIIASLFGKLFGLIVIQEVNGTNRDIDAAYPATKCLHWPLKYMQVWQYKIANGLVPVTEGLLKWLRAEGVTGSAKVIPNGANHVLFHPGAESSILLPKKYVIFFGALAPWQGINIILEAFSSNLWPKCTSLVIVGDGDARDSMANFENNELFHYLGNCSYDVLPGLIAKSVGTLSPQVDYLGRAKFGLFPLKVFESMACGVPVIVSNFAGQADLVAYYKCGLVVKPGCPQSLAEAVFELSRDSRSVDNRKMGENGRYAILGECSWDKRAEATLAFIREVAGNIK